MTKAFARQITRVLLSRFGQTYAQELGIPVEKNTPSALFRLLTATILFSARISSRSATRAAREFTNRGWTTAKKLAATTWDQRRIALDRGGYARYDERTSTLLGETARMVVDRYGGDLRKLREDAHRDPRREQELLLEFKGVGPVAVGIFFREVQVAWDELWPLIDPRSRQVAKQLRLPTDAGSLVALVGRQNFVRLVAALVRVSLARQQRHVLEEAAAAASGDSRKSGRRATSPAKASA